MKRNKTVEVQQGLLDALVDELYDVHADKVAGAVEDPTSEPFRRGVRFGEEVMLLKVIAFLRDARRQCQA
jgi:hypothetical protein